MWWKLSALIVVAFVAIVAVIPLRTRAVSYNLYHEQPPLRFSFGRLLAAMDFPPTTLILIALIVIAAATLAFLIVRAR